MAVVTKYDDLNNVMGYWDEEAHSWVPGPSVPVPVPVPEEEEEEEEEDSEEE